LAALPAFKRFTGINGANPSYDRKEKARAGDPGKFTGEKTLFDNWVHKLADKFEEDEPIFRREKSRMRLLMNIVEGEAMMSIETRYKSTTRPFSCLAEMIQALSAAYHDPNQATAARKALRTHYYKPGKNSDIHAFISRFNAFAMKAEVPESQWKANLWDRIPPHIDGRLLHDSEDDRISYEAFCNLVAKAVYSNQRGYEQRWDEHRPRDADTRTEHKGKNRAYSRDDKDKAKATPDTGRILSEAEKKVHWEADTCFTCGKTGHRAANCPGKKRVAAVGEDDSSSSPDESDESGNE